MIDGVEEVEIGWSVTPRRARQGIATEAAAAWRDRCLGQLGMDHVISLIRPENVPSRGVAERIGMTVWKETRHGSPALAAPRLSDRRGRPVASDDATRLLVADLDPLDHDVVDGTVLRTGRDTGDRLHHLVALGHLAEDRVSARRATASPRP